MHINDAVFLEDLCPKFRFRQWRKSIHKFTEKSCIYCGKPSESIDHVVPRSQGGLSKTENCVPACLSCNGDKSDERASWLPSIGLEWSTGIESKSFMTLGERWL